jgi:hypothetical protein
LCGFWRFLKKAGENGRKCAPSAALPATATRAMSELFRVFRRALDGPKINNLRRLLVITHGNRARGFT